MRGFQIREDPRERHSLRGTGLLEAMLAAAAAVEAVGGENGSRDGVPGDQVPDGKGRIESVAAHDLNFNPNRGGRP
jgi:hypothetical protein